MSLIFCPKREMSMNSRSCCSAPRCRTRAECTRETRGERAGVERDDTRPARGRRVVGAGRARRCRGEAIPDSVSARFVPSACLNFVIFHINMSSEIRLVQEIEKFECLYNYCLPEYNRKDLAEEAWAQVSSSTELTVAECKEKWRNIRSSLLRNLKPTDKPRKPYYLIPYLHFLIPFLKPLNNVEQKEELNASVNGGKESDIFICAVKSEDECQLTCDTRNSETISDEDSQSDPLLSHSNSLSIKRMRKESSIPSGKKRRHDQREIVYESNPITTIEPPRTISDSMRYFLLSLLPEFETMSEEQIRQFKIKVMMAIDDIKSNGEKVAMKLPNNTSDRLQKRLINLLLKNLEKS